VWRGVSGAMGHSPNSSFVTQMRTTEAHARFLQVMIRCSRSYPSWLCLPLSPVCPGSGMLSCLVAVATAMRHRRYPLQRPCPSP